MRRLAETIGREMKWTQPSAFKKEFELRDGDELAATLVFRSSLGTFATAETAEGTWSFKRVGFWATRVTVRDAADQEIATFRNNTWRGGGTLTLANGREYRATTNMWNSKYEFLDEREEPLVRYRKIDGVIHVSSWMQIAPAAATLAELPWLATLGWYLAVKMRDDDMAGTAAASAG